MKEQACDSSNITNEYFYEHWKFVHGEWFFCHSVGLQNTDVLQIRAKREKWNQEQYNNHSTEVQIQEKIHLF